MHNVTPGEGERTHEMFPSATISSRQSSGGGSSSDSYSRKTGMPSLRTHTPLSARATSINNPLAARTTVNPLFGRRADVPFTSFDAAHFVVQRPRLTAQLRRRQSHDEADVDIEADGAGPTSEPSSPDSTGNRRTGHQYPVREFLERYSLPRVVRVAAGEPILLYRCYESFTKVQAHAVAGKRGKEKCDGHILHFPEGYAGWFSLTNEKGEQCAVTHTSLLHLVREQVCSFLSIHAFTAYTAQPLDSTGDPLARAHYLKTSARPGRVYRLRAIYQHHEEKSRHSTRSRNTRSRDLANRYAQLIDTSTNQELYAPLTTKGEFYETHSSIKARLCFPGGLLQRTGPLALDTDCLYRLAHLLHRIHLPQKVKLVSGTLPAELQPGTMFILQERLQEPLLVTCTLPQTGSNTPHEINCLGLNSSLTVTRSMLGFDSERELFKSQRLQAALSHCHKYVEHWYRQVRLVPNIPTEVEPLQAHHSNDEIPRRYTEQLITKEVLEKFPKPKKWYRHFRILTGSSEKLKPIDDCDKVKSIDRYKDMSKLIEDKFGKKHYNPVKKSASFMFSTKRIDLPNTPTKQNSSSTILLKCQSVDTELYNEVTSTSKNTTPAPTNVTDETSTVPDLIPNSSSFITDRLRAEFHVKSKVINRQHVVDDIPYSSVVDEVQERACGPPENVYTEICTVERKQDNLAEYCYVKLGSNGESITQSSDDELDAIYNTLR